MNLGLGEADAPPLRGRILTRSFRGAITKQLVHYIIYLPEDYGVAATRSYATLYHLHGLIRSGEGWDSPATQNVLHRHAYWLAVSLERAIAANLAPPMILVFPDGHGDSMWADSRGGQKPAETNVVRELTPYIDAQYRTSATRGHRIIHGMSMGGFGAILYAAKFPDLYAVAVNYDGALHTWASLTARRPTISHRNFADDKAYFDRFSPWVFLQKNQSMIRGRVAFRNVVGSMKDRNELLRACLDSMEIQAEFVDTSCGHNFRLLLEREGLATFSFVARHIASC